MRLGDRPTFARMGLHGQHRFPVYDGGARVGQARARGIGPEAPAVGRGGACKGRYGRHGGRVAVDADVVGRVSGEGEPGGGAQPGGQLHHSVVWTDVQAVEHPSGQFDPAGSEDPFAESGQQPVAGHAGRVQVGARHRRLRGRTGSPRV